MQSRLLLLIVFALVFASGCIGQTQRPVRVVSNDGLQIIDFFAEPVDVEVGDTVLFTLQAENVGGTQARNVVGLLENVEGQWREVTGGPALPTAQQMDNLDPPNPRFNQPGDFDVATWIFRTPDLAPGLEYDATVTGKVIYDYNTSGAISIRALGETFLETEYLAKGKRPTGPEVFNTFAPVQIVINDRFLEHFIVVRDDASDPQIQNFPILIELVNVGSGFPITDGEPGTIFGAIKVSGPGNPVWQECLGNTNTNTAAISPNTLGAEIAKLKATRGKATIACTVSLNKNAFAISDESIRLDFFLEYRYYIQTPITVRISSFR